MSKRKTATADNLIHLDSIRNIIRRIDLEFRRANATRMQMVKAARRHGIMHPWVQARYGRRARLLKGLTLNAAITKVHQTRLDEMKKFYVASALGKGVRLSVDILTEMEILLRAIRRARIYDNEHFQTILAQVGTIPEYMIAAE